MAIAARSRIVDDLQRLMLDSGVTIGQLSRASGVTKGYISEMLAGQARPSVETYARLAVPLGADLATRLYPNTGPTIRDRHQGRILEWLLEMAHPRWRVFTEVGVRGPVRGWIDAVLHDARARLAIAIEIESELRRLEQQVRWHEQKAAALPSWARWPELGEEPVTTRLLIVRRTRATRAVVAQFGRQLRIAYPAHPDDAMAALTSTAPWPGSALLWVGLDGRRGRFVSGR
jgi:transcriptional regulator with XRE-family HTH domain